jgi:hypothetical protein
MAFDTSVTQGELDEWVVDDRTVDLASHEGILVSVGPHDKIVSSSKRQWVNVIEVAGFLGDFAIGVDAIHAASSRILETWTSRFGWSNFVFEQSNRRALPRSLDEVLKDYDG